jgi:hypothetical protein
MAQAAVFKSSIRYQVCNSTVENDNSHLSSRPDDDLCEIKISSPTNNKPSISLSSPNHHPSSSLTKLIPGTSSGRQTSSSIESATLIKSDEPSSPKNPLGSTLSISSLTKQSHTQYRQSRNSSIPSHNRQSISRQSIFDTLASTLTAVRKSSTTALALAQQRLSTDNGNLFSGYQGNILKEKR